MSNDLIDEDDFDPTPPPRTRLGVIVLVVLLHIVAIAGLIRAFTPDIAAKVVESVLSTFSVTVVTPPPPPPPPPSRSEKEAGDEGRAGKKAVPKAIKAPDPKIKLSQKPAPKASSTGSADTSGATNQGSGTGAGRTGDGTGAGGTGNGTGGGAVSKPSVRSGQINDSRDFPVPPGGRQARFGKRVIVHFTVTTDGRARNCSVASSSVDADTTARVCPLVMQRIRFNPAKRADGTPIEARYGYKVDFTAR
ncbi:MAG: TonB family protein [Novosphingobium sp.]|uniref:TonB family protein n=1 Tax=Novosphingobium sp. TaxID=1874826 RepID=UPI0032B9647B